MRRPSRGSGVSGRITIGTLLAVMLVAALAAPGGPRGTAAQGGAIETRVQILHAAPDLGQVEVHINGDEVLDEFAYGDLSEWVDIEPGGNRVTITEDRAGFNWAVFDSVYPVPAGNDYYMVITDFLVIGSVVDRSPIPDGGARVRVTHGSVDTPAVTVVATGEDIELATQLAYSQSSDYTTIPAGTYDLEVRLADTGEVALTISDVTVEGDMVYDFVAVGTVGDEDHPLEVRPLVDDTAERAATPVA